MIKRKNDDELEILEKLVKRKQISLNSLVALCPLTKQKMTVKQKKNFLLLR